MIIRGSPRKARSQQALLRKRGAVAQKTRTSARSLGGELGLSRHSPETTVQRQTETRALALALAVALTLALVLALTLALALALALARELQYCGRSV
jgi:hypothetical protein